MKKLLSALTLVFVVMLAGCEKTPEPVSEPSRRTVVVYMEARNNLMSNANDDLLEMERASVPGDCRLLVYLSGYGSAPELREFAGGRWVTRVAYDGETSSVSRGRLGRVLADAARVAPSRERGLVMWSHGFGWTQTSPLKKHSRAFGFENSQHVMSTSDIAAAIGDAGGVDFVYFDACFMASVEVAYELRNVARYMVASAAETPAAGMPYDLTLPALFAPDMVRGLAEAVDIVSDYYDENPQAHRGCPRTLSLIDLAGMDALAGQTARVLALGRKLPAGFEPQRFAVSATYENLYFDLREYAEALGADDEWRRALGSAVVHERHSSMIWNRLPLVNCCGLTVFIPMDGLTYDSFGYSTLEWAKYLNLCHQQ